MAGQHRPRPDDTRHNGGGRLNSFTFEHKRWLSLLGLLIVLGTYLSKETVLDEIKASADSIDFARQQSAARRECLSVRKDFALFTAQNNPPSDRATRNSSNRPESPKRKAIEDQIDLVNGYVEGLVRERQELDLVREDFEASAAVAKTLPLGDPAASSMKEAEAAIKKDQNVIDALDAQLEDFDKHDPQQQGYESLGRKTINAYLESGIPFDKARETTSIMSDKISAAAKQIYEAKTSRIRRIKLFCHLLFILGWGLSLVDKMYLDTAGSASE